MQQKAENITFNFLPYAVFSGFDENSKKYEGKQKNAYESKRRLSKIALIQNFSDAICLELGIPKVNLKPTGSAKAGYANEKSDLDIYAQISQDHPLNIRETRKVFAMKMQFILKASMSIDFPVYIFFVTS